MAGQPTVDISLVLSTFWVAGLALVWLAGWAGWVAGGWFFENGMMAGDLFFEKCCFFISFNNFFGGWAGWLAGLAGWLSGWLASQPSQPASPATKKVVKTNGKTTFFKKKFPSHHSIFKNPATGHPASPASQPD